MGTAAALAAAVSIAQECSEEDALRRAVVVGCSLLDADRGSAWLAGPDGGEARVVWEPDHADPALRQEGDPSLVVPVVGADEELLGRLEFVRDRGRRRFAAGHRLTAESLGRQAGAVIARIRARAAVDAVLSALGPTASRTDDPPPVAGESSPTVRRLLGAAHAVLGMDLTFLSNIADGRQTFDDVVARAAAPALRPGTTIDADEGYCGLLLDGVIPAAVSDVPAHPVLGAMAVTTDLQVGAYCGVPVRLPDGSLYGTLCGLHSSTASTPSPAQMEALRIVAGLVGECLHDEQQVTAELEERRAALRAVIAGERRHVVLQPIVDLRDGSVVGHEALSRFADARGGSLPPDRVFAEARELGLSVELEQAAARDALALLPAVPEGTYLSVNLSPDALLHPDTDALLPSAAASQVVVEITEHEVVADYPGVQRALAGHRARGLRLAVDDTGAGFASLYHLTQLAPEIIKLDIAFVRGLLDEPACRAVTAAVAGYAADVGALLIAEGVGTHEQAAALRDLGAGFGQGYHHGRPQDPAILLGRCTDRRFSRTATSLPPGA